MNVRLLLCVPGLWVDPTTWFRQGYCLLGSDERARRVMMIVAGVLGVMALVTEGSKEESEDRSNNKPRQRINKF